MPTIDTGIWQKATKKDPRQPKSPALIRKASRQSATKEDSDAEIEGYDSADHNSR